jgi:Mg-chelatase subunit ChlD
MFAKFSDHFEVMGFPLCYEPKLLSLANWSLPVNQPFHGHSTRLWDCIVEGIETFVKAADQKRPWLAIILTDGEDIDSKKHDMNAAAAAMAIFNRGQGNLTCVIGLGNQVGSKMEAICQATGSLYVPVAKAEILPVVFAVLALHVVKGVRIDVAKIASQDATLVLAQAREVAHLQRMPVDVMMMIDVSGSMYKN